MIDEGWHPVGLSSSVETATSAGTRLFGKELVVWRDSSGIAHVWEDRCPHRGMRLSFGFVRGDHIACLYHGWQYDTAGQCRYIPAHPDLDVPRTIKVPLFRTVEQAGMIWASADAGTDSLPVSGDIGETVMLRSLYMDCPAEAVVAVLETSSVAEFGGEMQPLIVERREGAQFCLSAGKDRLFAGLQVLDDERTALHIVIAGEAARYAGAGQKHFLRFAEDLRYRAEHASARRKDVA